MGKKATGRTGNKYPKINTKTPNRFVSYLHPCHMAFIFGMIANETYKNQSEVTNEAYRLFKERYIAKHGQVKYDNLIKKGKAIISKAKKKDEIDVLRYKDDNEDDE